MISMCLAMLADDSEREYFLKIHTEHEALMMQTALKKLKDQSLAEDAVQESWLRVAASFKNILVLDWDAIGGYLVILVRNVCYDMRQKENKTEEIPEGWDTPAPSEKGGILRRIVEIIQAMPPAYRDILEMKYVMEYTNREIGHKLKVNESTVASRVMRGRTLLMETLRKKGFDETGWVI